MSEEAAAAIDAKLKALGNGKKMPGEGNDRLFEVEGRQWRVRLAIRDEVAPIAPVNGSPSVAPEAVGYCISVAALDGGEVAKDEAGRLQIFPTTITLQPSLIGRDDFDPEREILIAVADQIAVAAAQLSGRMKMASLKKWHG